MTRRYQDHPLFRLHARGQPYYVFVFLILEHHSDDIHAGSGRLRFCLIQLNFPDPIDNTLNNSSRPLTLLLRDPSP
jgi:hypothetical protein